MDPLSHAALGAALAQSAAGRKAGVAATAVAALAAMAPDADVLIRSANDPLLALEFHRHFTHSLSFAPIGALCCAALLWPLCRHWLTFGKCYLFGLLGYFSHGLLDACTSYGTRLFWPFGETRVALDIISVVDPLWTLPLLGMLIIGVRWRPRLFALLGIVWCAAYLGLGAYQKQRALEAAGSLAASRAHEVDRLIVKPTFGNLLLWKAIYERRGRYYIDAIRLRRGPQVFSGESLLKLDPERDFPWLEPGSQQWQDLARFREFTDDYLGIHPTNPLRVVDLRYSFLPNTGDALWGIELDPAAAPDMHAAYVTMRIRSTAEGRELLDMIFR